LKGKLPRIIPLDELQMFPTNVSTKIEFFAPDFMDIQKRLTPGPAMVLG
jgi:hypothetical protein